MVTLTGLIALRTTSVQNSDFNQTMVHFEYVPLKIYSRRTHNIEIAPPNTNEEDYMMAVINFIKQKLDEGYVLGLPMLQHFITVIGYNSEDKLLMVGSFGERYDKGGLHVQHSSLSPMMLGDALQSIIIAKVPSEYSAKAEPVAKPKPPPMPSRRSTRKRRSTRSTRSTRSRQSTYGLCDAHVMHFGMRHFSQHPILECTCDKSHSEDP